MYSGVCFAILYIYPSIDISLIFNALAYDFSLLHSTVKPTEIARLRIELKQCVSGSAEDENVSLSASNLFTSNFR